MVWFCFTDESENESYMRIAEVQKYVLRIRYTVGRCQGTKNVWFGSTLPAACLQLLVSMQGRSWGFGLFAVCCLPVVAGREGGVACTRTDGRERYVEGLVLWWLM